MSGLFSGKFSMIAYFFKGRSVRLVLSVLITALTVCLAFISPQIISFTVDFVIGDEPAQLPAFLSGILTDIGGRDFLRGHIYVCALAALICALLAGVCNFYRRYLTSECGEYAIRRMRDGLFSHIQHLPFSWHMDVRTGDIIQRCTADVETIRNFINFHLSELVRMFFLLIVASLVMFSMDTFMALITLAFLPVMLASTFFFFRRIGRRFLAADTADGALQTMVQENLTGVRVIRAFGRERFELERFDQLNEDYCYHATRMGRLMAAYWVLQDVITGLQVMLVVVFGILRCYNGHMTLGMFLAFFVYAGMLIWPIRSLGRIISELSKAGISAGRIFEVLSSPAESDRDDAGSPEIRGEIEFRDVTFAHKGSAPVLQNLSFKIPEGGVLAILGATGSGKSTVAQLLNRLYELPPDGGSILIDGVDIRSIELGHLRKNIGFVLQDSYLFSRTIAENIAVGSDGIPLGHIRDHAVTAAIDDSITAFPQGYDTMIGERGVTLSGGQRQRVSIARTLVRDTPILVFDDSLSAVDTETESLIWNNLFEHQNQKNRTTIIISHRITTLMKADRIIVLREGKIAESGSHEQLLKAGGAYRRIYELQSELD